MSSNSTNTSDRESADLETIDTAVESLAAGRLDKAESLLLGVIANTPSDYTNSVEDDEGISIKFWDQDDFIHYVTWQQDQGLATKNIHWIGNAYPRAYYYLGFICVKRKQFARAIEFLDRGLALEPTNAMFVLEKAQALVHSGRKREALALYDQVEAGPFVSGHKIAVARRGRGFVQIELGELDAAEASFRSSLELEPDNDIALHELEYIEHLRQGGAATYAEAIPSQSPDITKCAACGIKFEKGIVVSIEGIPVGICNRCERKLTKKWWQFWK